jgi:hypothetical protein
MPDLRVVRAFEVWVRELPAPHFPTLLTRIARALVVAALMLPDLAVADHVPDGVSQDVDPNYIACLKGVDDAKPQFLDALQATCLTRMIEICRGSDNEVPPAQVIECISFETRRGIGFLQAAVTELPESVEKTGLASVVYARRRDSIVKNTEVLRAFAAPESIDVAVEHSISMALSANLLFYLARETGTPLDALVEATIDKH